MTPRACYDEALRALDLGQPERGEALLREALAGARRDANAAVMLDATRTLGELLARLGRSDEARSLLHVLAPAPGDPGTQQRVVELARAMLGTAEPRPRGRARVTRRRVRGAALDGPAASPASTAGATDAEPGAGADPEASASSGAGAEAGAGAEPGASAAAEAETSAGPRDAAGGGGARAARTRGADSTSRGFAPGTPLRPVPPPPPRRGASEAELRRAEAALGRPLPPDYRAVMSERGAFEGTLVPGVFLDLWPVSELSPLNRLYELDTLLPGVTAFGTDGGNTGFGWRVAPEGVDYVAFPLTGAEPAAVQSLGSSCVELLERLMKSTERREPS